MSFINKPKLWNIYLWSYKHIPTVSQKEISSRLGMRFGFKSATNFLGDLVKMFSLSSTAGCLSDKDDDQIPDS